MITAPLTSWIVPSSVTPCIPSYTIPVKYQEAPHCAPDARKASRHIDSTRER